MALATMIVGSRISRATKREHATLQTVVKCLLIFVCSHALANTGVDKFEIWFGNPAHLISNSVEESCRISLGDADFRFVKTESAAKAAYTCWCHGNPGASCSGALGLCPAGMVNAASPTGAEGSGCHTNPPQHAFSACWVFDTANGCVFPSNKPTPGQNTGKPDPGMCPLGNPINPATGNKFQEEVDWRGTGPFPLEFVRYYNSEPTVGDGTKWTYSYNRNIRFLPENTTYPTAFLMRDDGRQLIFTQSGNAWLTASRSVVGTLSQFVDGTGATTGWTFRNERDETESYDAVGKLTQITSRDGFVIALDYNVSVVNGGDGIATTLDVVRDALAGSDPLGRKLKFVHSQVTVGNRNVARLDKVLLPSGKEIVFSSTTAVNDNELGRLDTVTYPDLDADPTNNPKRQYKYDEAGLVTNTNYTRLLTGIVDENNNRFTTWKYDANGRANYSEHGNGTTLADRVQLQFDFGGVANATQFTDANNQNETQNYTIIDGIAKMSAVTNGQCALCGGRPKAASYDSNGFLQDKKDINGNITRYKFDPQGRETCRLEGISTSTVPPTDPAYIAPGYRLTVTDYAHLSDPTLRVPHGIKTYAPTNPAMAAPATCVTAPLAADWTLVLEKSFTYVGGRLTTKTDSIDAATIADDRTTNYTYYPSTDIRSGLLKEIIGPRAGMLTTLDYFTDYASDHQGGDLKSLTRATVSGAPLLSYIDTYNGNGQPLTLRDVNNTSTVSTRDALDRVRTSTVGGQLTQFSYDNIGQLAQVTLPTGAFTHYDYDAAHRLVRIKDNLNNKIEYTLDAMGNRTADKFYDPVQTLKQQVTRVYTVLNRLDQLIGGAASQTTRFTYDPNGNLRRTIDPRDPAPATPTIFSDNFHDARNRVRQVLDTMNKTTVYTRDVLDNLKAMTDPRGLSTNYAFNGFSDVLQQSSQDSGTTSYAYDAAGNRIQQTDARGVVTNYQYDALNRQTRIDNPSEPDIQMTYDAATGGPGAKGRLTSIADRSGTTEYQYDARGNTTQIKTTHDGLVHILGFAYNGADQLIRIDYPSGRSVLYNPDAAGRISDIQTSLGGTTTPLISAITYAPFSAATGYTYGNGVSYTAPRDLSDRITTLTHSNGLVNRSYGYDLTDNIQNVNDLITPAKSETLAYDNLNRVLTAAATGSYGTQSFGTYDEDGNRPSFTLNGTAAAYSYVASKNQLSGVAGGPALSYDAAGNPTSRSPLTLTYSEENRLSSIATGGRTVATYGHNGLGQRVKKGNGVLTTYYLYGTAGELLAEATNTGAITREYAYFVGTPIAVLVPDVPPASLDTDGDGMPDAWEIRYGLNPNSAADATTDTDNDGLTNVQEYNLGTDPTKNDTDGDGVLDGADSTPLGSAANWLVPIHKMILR